MKYLSIFLIAVCVGCTSYDVKKNQPCAAQESVEQTPWIMDQLNKLKCGVCGSAVFSAVYKGQPVIYIPCGGPACDCISTKFLYDCTGNLVKAVTDSPDDQADAKQNLSPFTQIYSCNP